MGPSSSPTFGDSAVMAGACGGGIRPRSLRGACPARAHDCRSALAAAHRTTVPDDESIVGVQWLGQRAHSTHRRVAGRATSRSKPIGPPHCSQAPNSSSSRVARVCRSAAASRIAWLCSALTCARSNAIVVPSGSCSSSVFDISAAVTMSSNCRASDTACSSVRPSSATSAERIVRRSRSVSARIRGTHHAYTSKGLRTSRRHRWLSRLRDIRVE